MSEQIQEAKAHIDMVAFVALLIGGIAIGTSPIFMRYAQEVVTPTSAAFWRLVLSLPILISWQLYDITKNTKKNTGKIIFEYNDLDQLNKIIEIIKSNY